MTSLHVSRECVGNAAILYILYRRSVNFDELGFKGQRFNLSRQTDTHYALAGFKFYSKKVTLDFIRL